MLLSNATVVSLDDGVLTLRFARDGDVKGFTTSGCDADLQPGPRGPVRPERPDQGTVRERPGRRRRRARPRLNAVPDPPGRSGPGRDAAGGREQRGRPPPGWRAARGAGTPRAGAARSAPGRKPGPPGRRGEAKREAPEPARRRTTARRAGDPRPPRARLRRWPTALQRSTARPRLRPERTAASAAAGNPVIVDAIETPDAEDIASPGPGRDHRDGPDPAGARRPDHR